MSSFRGLGRGLQLSSGAATSSASNSVAGSVCSHSGAGTARSRRKGSGGGGGGLVHTRGDGGASSGGGSSGVSFVLKNKRHAAKARRRLTDEQVTCCIRWSSISDECLRAVGTLFEAVSFLVPLLALRRKTGIFLLKLPPPLPPHSLPFPAVFMPSIKVAHPSHYTRTR